jgi:ABC-type spermidine/putrescine transport system permease subunit II
MIKRILSLLFLLTTVVSNAQETTSPQMADAMRENGKIYIVISVIALIFLALVLFLVFIERRVKKLEEELKNK